MSDIEKSLKFAATSSGWSEGLCTVRHAHHFACSPSSRRRSRWTLLDNNVARWFSSLRPNSSKRVSMG